MPCSPRSSPWSWSLSDRHIRRGRRPATAATPGRPSPAAARRATPPPPPPPAPGSAPGPPPRPAPSPAPSPTAWPAAPYATSCTPAVGGTSARITLSNLYGSSPLTITHASIAVAAAPEQRRRRGRHHAPAHLRRQPRRSSSRPGRQVISDAVRVRIPPGADVLVTTYSPQPVRPGHLPPARPADLVRWPSGDRTEDVTGAAYTEQSPYWRYLTAAGRAQQRGRRAPSSSSATRSPTASPPPPAPTAAGPTSSPSGCAPRPVRRHAPLQRRQPGHQRQPGPAPTASAARPTTPAGCPASDVTCSTVRTSRPSSSTSASTTSSATPHQTDPRHDRRRPARPWCEQAHARGLRVVGATLMPFQGHRGYTDRAGRRTPGRQRGDPGRARSTTTSSTSTRRCATRTHPRRLRPDYDSGDHLHPSDKGYRADGARCFDLEDLKGSSAGASCSRERRGPTARGAPRQPAAQLSGADGGVRGSRAPRRPRPGGAPRDAPRSALHRSGSSRAQSRRSP